MSMHYKKWSVQRCRPSERGTGRPHCRADTPRHLRAPPTGVPCVDGLQAASRLPWVGRRRGFMYLAPDPGTRPRHRHAVHVAYALARFMGVNGHKRRRSRPGSTVEVRGFEGGRHLRAKGWIGGFVATVDDRAPRRARSETAAWMSSQRARLGGGRAMLAIAARTTEVLREGRRGFRQTFGVDTSEPGDHRKP